MRIDASMHSPLRRLEGRRRRAGAGVRALLRDADGVLPRRLPHRARITPAPSCTASSPTSRARSARAGRTGSSATSGKQVRDNIHAHDVCAAMMAFAEAPRRRGRLQPRRRPRERDLGARGDRALRGADSAERSPTEYVDEPRRGDHICYISDLSRLRADYPEWEVTVSLDDDPGRARPRGRPGAVVAPARTATAWLDRPCLGLETGHGSDDMRIVRSGQYAPRRSSTAGSVFSRIETSSQIDQLSR